MKKDKIKEEKGMQVLILCGGKGTRMRGLYELDEEQRKCKHRRFVLSRVVCTDCGAFLQDECTIKGIKNIGIIETLRDIKAGVTVEKIMEKNNIIHLGR